MEEEKNTVSTKNTEEEEISKACDEVIDTMNTVIGFLFLLFVIIGTIIVCCH